MDKLPKEMVAHSRLIAKGNRIREVQRLLDLYGGQRTNWTKKSSPVFEDMGSYFEYHWYEHPDVGKVEIKLKEVSEK